MTTDLQRSEGLTMLLCGFEQLMSSEVVECVHIFAAEAGFCRSVNFFKKGYFDTASTYINNEQMMCAA